MRDPAARRAQGRPAIAADDALDAHTGAFDGPPEAQFKFLEKLHERSSHKCRNFAEIHAAPEGQRPALVKRMIEENWTIEDTRREVALVKPPIPLNPRGRSRQLSIYESVSLDQWQTLDKKTQTTPAAARSRSCSGAAFQ